MPKKRIPQTGIAPEYRKVDDLLLIGVNHKEIKHQKKVQRIRNLVRIFVKKIRVLDHLAMEGHADIRVYNDAMGIRNFEQLAINSFNGEQVHFLDEDTNYAELLEKFGISKMLFGIFKLLKGFPHIVTPTASGEEVVNGMKNYLEVGVHLYPGFRDVPVSTLNESMTKILAAIITSDLEQILDAAEAFEKYLARFRDHIIYAPKLRKIRADHRGKIGAVLGKNHIDVLFKLLRGQKQNVYPNWAEYVKGLDIGTRKGIDFVEKLADEIC